MDKRQIIATIIQYAEALERLGFVDESDDLTNIAPMINDLGFAENNDRTFDIDNMIGKSDDMEQRLKDEENFGFGEESNPDIILKRFKQNITDAGAAIADPYIDESGPFVDKSDPFAGE